MKHDEREKQKEIYYKEQQQNVLPCLKHNTKEANTIKSIFHTSLKLGPMGDAVIKGYIKKRKKMTLLLMETHRIIFNLKAI